MTVANAAFATVPSASARSFSAASEPARPPRALRADLNRKQFEPGSRAALNSRGAPAASEELRESFSTFLGETFYTQLIKSMRSTVDKPAYFHGGRGEEVFQSQLDQVFAEEMTEATADQLSGPMFDLFALNLQRR